MPRFQRVPPRRPVTWAQTLRLWSALLAGGVALALVVRWSERLPAPAPAAAPADAFAAARAWPHLARLADTIGHRLPGTPTHELARAYLLERLRALPGVEVVEQDAVGVRPGAAGPRAYRVRNVLARIPGRSRDAVLLSTHYDTPSGSVGAADAAVAVAVALEVARALAQGEPLAHSVILLLNDGEEHGLFGAHAFLRHPWRRDVRAVVNLESAGNEGKAILFQAGPGNAWLADRYAASAPHPYGSVIGQDIFQSGLIPSATDFEIYAGDGMRGLDVAFHRGGWAYHTPLDRVAAIAPGSVQHMGANALAVVRALAAGPLPGDVGGRPSVYYDLLGVTMVAHDQGVAWAIAATAALLLGLALRAVLARRALSLRDVLVATAWQATAGAAAVATTVALAAVGPYLLGRPHGWFAHPGRGAAAYGLTALAVLALAHWRLADRRRMRDLAPADRWLTTWSGALLLHLAALVVLTAGGVGSAFLFAWWSLGGALGLAIAARDPDARWLPAAAVGLLPGAVLTLQTATLLVLLFGPVAGRFPLVIPFDLVIAAIVATSAVTLLAAPLALLQRAERVGVATAAAGVAALVALVVLWSTFPYAPDRPQRLVVRHEGSAAGATLRVQTLDWPGPARAVAAAGAWPEGPARIEAAAAVYPAPPLADAPPAVELLAQRPVPGGRELELRVLPGADAHAATLRAPDGRRVQWRVQGDPDGRPHAGQRLALVAAPDGGWVVTLAVDDAAPLSLEATAVRRGPSPAAAELLRRLPAWSAPYAESMARTTVTF